MLDQIPAEARSVDGIRRLMKQLCEALEALSEGVSLAAPDTVRALLAARSNIIPAIDERLTKSAELVRRGLRDEAMSYAAEPPDLVQAATLLDISGHVRWKVWQAKLTELNIPAPPIPRMDLVATLTKAQDQLVRLKPLLDAWRRMNLGNAPLTNRITMLGKLRKADPENELWFEALQEHQKHRIPVLEREVAAAVSGQDDQRLSDLVEEMKQEWIEPVPPRILATAKAALERFRGGRIDRELNTLADSLAAAHHAKDLDAARTLRERWQEMVDEKGSFVVDDSRLAAAMPAVSWVDAHARMATVSEEIRSSLDAQPGGLRVRQEWVRSLERLGNEMEDLAEKLEGDADVEAIERAHERIGRQRDRLERDLWFRRMMIYVGIASASVVLGLCVWYFDDQARYASGVQAALRDLRETQEKIAAGALEELPEYERILPPKIAGNAEVGSLLTIVRSELEQQTGRRGRLKAALEKANENLRSAETAARPDPLLPWPPAFAIAARSISEIEAAKLTVTDQEQADVTRVKKALDRLASKLVDAADAVCRQRIKDIDAQLDNARSQTTADSDAAIRTLENVKAAVADLRGQAAAPAVAEASATYAIRQIASEPMITMLSPGGSLLQKAESIEKILANRAKFLNALRELDGRLGDWSQYATQLEAIARDFPGFTEARDYGHAAESKAKWLAVDAWKQFQPSLQRLDLATPEKASETIAQFKALSQETKDLPTAKRVQEALVPAIEQLASRDLAKLADELEKWFKGPWLEELKFVVLSEDGFTAYSLVGHPKGRPNFAYVTGQKDAETGWPTKKSQRIADSVEQSPQSRLADALRAEVRRANATGGIAVDQLFVSLLEAVLDAKGVDPLPRLVTARKIVLLAAGYSRPWSVAGRPLAKILTDGEGIPGLSTGQLWSFVPPTRDDDSVYQLTKEKAEALLKEIRSGLSAVKDAIVKEQKLLMTPPMSSVGLVGRLGRNSAGDLVAIWKDSAPSAGKVWWFPPRADVALAGDVDDKGVFKPASTSVPAGTPLFTRISGANGANGNTQQAAGQGEE